MSVQNEIEVTGEPTVLYRFYDAEGRLLYVGITGNGEERFKAHAANWWWDDVTRKTAVLYGSREEARAAEDRAIGTEHPVYNINGKSYGFPRSMSSRGGKAIWKRSR